VSRDKYPNSIPKDEWPERAVEYIPQDVLDAVLSFAVEYGACPNCKEEQFYPVLAGHNTTWDCRECGFEMRVVG
jgi:ribosomal protein S27AE